MQYTKRVLQEATPNLPSTTTTHKRHKSSKSSLSQAVPTIYSSPFTVPSLPATSIFHYHWPLPHHSSDIPRWSSSLPAFIEASTSKVMTRGDLEVAAKRLGLGMLERGIKTGDVALIFSPNCLEYTTVFFGCQAAGLVVALANATYQSQELALQIKMSNASLLFAHPDLVETLCSAVEILQCSNPAYSPTILVMDESGRESYLKYMCATDVARQWEGVRFENGQEHETAVMCFSSGTTGLFKAVELSHFNLTSLPRLFMEPLKNQFSGANGDSLLGILPFYHIYGIACVMCRSLHYAVPVIIIKKFEPTLFLQHIQTYKPTWSLIVPPILLFLARSPLVANYDISSLRTVSVGAAPCPDFLTREASARLPNLIVTQGYGLTEMSPSTHYLPVVDAQRKSGSIGRLLPHITARIVDDHGRDLPVGVAGEMLLKGPTTMKGYHDNKQANEAAFTRDGWFKTGDLAKVDSEGFFYIIDRLKELIKFKGSQVAPAELEALLISHPRVADAGVCGCYDKNQATELPRGFLVPVGGLASLPSEADKAEFIEDVNRFVNARVASFKRLRGGCFLLEKIPKSASGKILRRDLRSIVIPDV